MNTKELLEKLETVELDYPHNLFNFIYFDTDYPLNPTTKVARYVECIEMWEGRLLKRVFAFRSSKKRRHYSDMLVTEVFRKLEGQTGCLLKDIGHNMGGKQVEFDPLWQCKKFYANDGEWTFSNCWKFYDEQNIIDKYDLTYCQWFNKKNHSYCDFFNYICAYRQEPRIELLVKADLSQFVHCYRKLNLKGKSLDQIFRINNYFVQFLKELSYSDIMIIRNKKRHVKNMDDLQIVRNFLCGMGREHSKIKKYTCPKMVDYLKSANYQFKQDYNDYLSFCEKLDYNLNDYSILCPKKMKEEHDKAMKLISIKKDEQTKEKFFNAYKDLLEYTYSKNNYLIVPCESVSELEEESKQLNHCVKTYAQKYADRKTNIMFIRNINEIDKPLYTLEFKDKTVIQCRAKNNDKPCDEALAFVRSWAKLNELECNL